MKHKAYDIPGLRARLTTAFPPVVPRHTATAHFYERTDTGRVTASVTGRIGFVGKGYLKQWAVNVGIDHVDENKLRAESGEWDVVLNEARLAHSGSLEQSADIGTTAHSAIDKCITEWIETGIRPVTAATFLKDGARGEEVAATRSFDKFVVDNEILPVASEIVVWYEVGRDCYAGSVDCIFVVRTPHKGRKGQEDGSCIHDYARQESGILWCSCGREVEEKLILGDHKTSNSIKGKDDYAQQSVAYAKAIEKAVGCRFDEIWIMRYGKARAEYEVCRVSDRKAAWNEFLSISRAYDKKALRGEKSLLEPLTTKEVIKI